MQWFTALFLTGLSLLPSSSFSQETVQDWSKKVIELQENEGQNFDQDLQLVKGYLYLQRRGEALALLGRLMKSSGKKDPRLNDLYETASDQFFLQDTAEAYAGLIQLIKEESWNEAKEKVEAALQKEGKQRLLTLRAIQLGLILNQNELLLENSKNAESNFSEFPVWRVYSGWSNLSKGDAKEAYRISSALWGSDRQLFEKTELAVLTLLESLELTKHTADWAKLSS